MCQILKLPDREIETLGDLKALWPTLVRHEYYRDIPVNNDSCLCPVDLIKTAEANGARAEHDGQGDVEVIQQNKCHFCGVQWENKPTDKVGFCSNCGRPAITPLPAPKDE